MSALFNKDIPPACKYCSRGKDCPGLSKTLCEREGFVEPEHSCGAFRYDPLRRVPQKPADAPAHTPEEFTL